MIVPRALALALLVLAPRTRAQQVSAAAAQSAAAGRAALALPLRPAGAPALVPGPCAAFLSAAVPLAPTPAASAAAAPPAAPSLFAAAAAQDAPAAQAASIAAAAADGPARPAGPQQAPSSVQGGQIRDGGSLESLRAARDGAFDGRSGGDPDDVTVRLLELHRQVRMGTAGALPAAARAAGYLWVPGLFAEHAPNYFANNLTRMRALGLNSRALAIDTDARAHEDMRLLAEAVAAAPEPLVLIGHSRGAMLIHDWYRAAPPELKAKVARIVLIQGPLLGSPVADWVVDSRARAGVAWLVEKLFVRTHFLTTIRKLTTEVRAAAVAGLPPLTPEDLAKIWVLRTRVGPHTDHGIYGLGDLIIRRAGHAASDGMVPADSARVGGARDAYIRDLNHSSVVGPPGLLRRLLGFQTNPLLTPGDLTEALVRLIFAPAP